MGALDAIARENLGARLFAPIAAAEQPPLPQLPPLSLHAAVGSLAIGGAERIVLDWAAAASRKHHVRLIVLRSTPVEWPVPQDLEIIRLGREDVLSGLVREGARIAASGNAQVLCHLLTGAERAALQRGGAWPIPVVHNARQGWIEPGDVLRSAPWVIAVSQAAAADLHAAGCDKVSVVRHVPPRRAPGAGARRHWRSRWQVPNDAFVIGMAKQSKLSILTQNKHDLFTSAHTVPVIRDVATSIASRSSKNEKENRSDNILINVGIGEAE